MKIFIIAAWLVTVIVGWADRQHVKPTEAYQTRIQGIVVDAALVASDPTEPPLSGLTRTETLDVMIAVAWFESFFSRDVEAGKRRGDQGQSWCFMQVRVADGSIVMVGDEYRLGLSAEGWTGKALVADRSKCFRAGLHMLRKSMRECGDLSQYTTGKCQRGGNREAMHRMNLARTLFGKEPAGAGIGDP